MNPSNYEENLGGSAKIVFDVSKLGGDVGDIPLPIIFPKNSIIFQAFCMPGLGEDDVIKPISSQGGATVMLSIQDQGDLLAATAYGGFASYLLCSPTLIGPIITTARKQLILTVGASPLDEGIVDIFVEYRHGFDAATPVVPPAVP